MNENEFELNGKRYVARTISPEDEDECDGNVCIMCAFGHDEDGCHAAPPCADFERDDEREVVFIKA